MEWSTRRKVLYSVSFVVLILAFGIYGSKDFLFKEPTCFDGSKNGFEIGVDCGGVCSLKCSQEVTPLIVKWTRIIQISPVKYDLVAMVSNKNLDHSAKVLGYTFTAYDKDGVVVGVFTGSTTEPVDGDFPIIHQNVSLPDTVKTFTAELHDGLHYGVTSYPTSPIIRIIDSAFEQTDIPRVYALVANTRQKPLENIPVIVLLYNDSDSIYAVNKTYIPFLRSEETKKISFTWPGASLPQPSKIRIYPILDPFTHH